MSKTCTLVKIDPIAAAHLHRLLAASFSHYPRSSHKPYSSASSSSVGGSVIVLLFTTLKVLRGQWGSSDSAEHGAFESFLRQNRCMRYYLEWNVCVDQVIRNGQDHRIQWCRLSKVLRNCVRLS